MKLVIQIAESDDARAWALLQRHSPGVALPDRTFVVGNEAAVALRDAGIHFSVLSTDAATMTDEGVATGERI
ncbi:MAG: hypothetical protein IH991_09575 [Planctomycetes bacterium]|nr:hypothetical protein [Planctomycetota bacterium]